MSNHKRTFCELQDIDGESPDYPSTSKKLKTEIEHPLKLYLRLRPTLSDLKSANSNESKLLGINLEENTVSVFRNGNFAGKKDSPSDPKFQFTQVFASQTAQQEIMKTVGVPIIEDVLSTDKPGLVLSYGATLAEKMYTLMGDADDPGMLPRSIEMLLDMKTRVIHGLSEKVSQWLSQGQDNGLMKDLEVLEDNSKDPRGNGGGCQAVDLRIYIEAFEIYNEEVYDLLKGPKKENNPGSGNRQKVFLKDLSIIELMSPQQSAQVLSRCQTNFEVNDGLKLERSTKSHLIFRLILKYAHRSQPMPNTGGTRNYTTSSLCFVSLAAPEKLQKGALSPSHKENHDESIISLDSSTPSQNSKKPSSKEYKLTRVLYKYFSGDCNLRLIAHLNDRPTNLEEVMSILTYTAQIKGTKVPNACSISSTSKMNSESISKALLFQENVSNTVPLLSIKDENSSPSLKSVSNVNNSPSVGKFEITQSAQKPLPELKATPKAQNLKTAPSVQTIPSVQSSARKPSVAESRGQGENRGSSCTSRPQYGTNSHLNRKVIKLSTKKLMAKGNAAEKPNPLRKGVVDNKVAMTEKDLKIKVLEELLHKLEEKVLLQTLNEKMQNIDESYNTSLQSLINTMEDTTKMGFLSFNSNPTRKNNNNSKPPECCFSKGPFSPTSTMIPVNVNYFIFQGPMGTERINSLESIFRANTEKSVGQNHILIMENQGPKGLNKQSHIEMLEERIDDDMKVEDNNL